MQLAQSAIYVAVKRSSAVTDMQSQATEFGRLPLLHWTFL